MTAVKLGFDFVPNGGPGIFLSRLAEALQAQGAFDVEHPDVWLQLSHQTRPDWLAQRPDVKLLVRTAGGYYHRHYWIKKPFIFPVPFMDRKISRQNNAKRNARIIESLQSADGIVFQSVFAREMTQHFLCPTPPGTIIYNAVDTRQFCPPASRPKADRTFNLLVSHAFRPQKRLHDAIAIVAALQQALPGVTVTLNVVGSDDGVSIAYAQARVTQLGIEENIRFWGKVPFQELHEIYQQCHAMLAVPLWDPCPNVVVEALSCGLPVLGAASGGIPELVGPAGYLVEERIPLDYLDHTHFDRIPKAPVKRYVAGALALWENLADYQALARERALTMFDIQHCAAVYTQAAQALLGQPAVVLS